MKKIQENNFVRSKALFTFTKKLIKQISFLYNRQSNQFYDSLIIIKYS